MINISHNMKILKIMPYSITTMSVLYYDALISKDVKPSGKKVQLNTPLMYQINHPSL